MTLALRSPGSQTFELVSGIVGGAGNVPLAIDHAGVSVVAFGRTATVVHPSGAQERYEIPVSEDLTVADVDVSPAGARTLTLTGRAGVQVLQGRAGGTWDAPIPIAGPGSTDVRLARSDATAAVVYLDAERWLHVAEPGAADVVLAAPAQFEARRIDYQPFLRFPDLRRRVVRRGSILVRCPAPVQRSCAGTLTVRDRAGRVLARRRYLLPPLEASSLDLPALRGRRGPAVTEFTGRRALRPVSRKVRVQLQ